MSDKEKYLKYAKDTFKGKALDLVLKQIELFYQNQKIVKNKYNKGEDVFLKKHTFLHGLGANPDGFDFVVDEGFICQDFNHKSKNKVFHSIGMWNIQEDCYLKDYIKFYSGGTIKYYEVIDDKPNEKYIVSSFGNLEEDTIKVNNMKNVWMWQAEQTKEVRFMPSLASDKVQIGFILNMESDYAKELSYADVYNKEFNEDILKYFCVEMFLDELIAKGVTPQTTDRESSIFFGLPSTFIEGVLVGRKYEQDIDKLNYIKNKLPDCYICNLDGTVIVGNY